MSRLLLINPRRGKDQWWVLLLSLAVISVVGLLGAIASSNAREFYALLVKPSWAPGPGIFGPMWTLLYFMMAVAAWLVWRARGRMSAVRGPMLLYAAQLLCNVLWSWLFFRWHMGGLALLDVCVLWLLILATLVHFWLIKPLAGMLLVPYLLWVAFATALTAAQWRLNPDLL
ncbi:MAG: TspO/MBR family protein [Steroidobacteraceae bacterium]